MTETDQLAEFLRPLWVADASGLPKYKRLANLFLSALKQGLLRPGDRLPAEEELAALTPFSLGTVQRSLGLLAEQGLIVRRHGLGSFVAEAQQRIKDPGHCRFIGDDGATVLPLYSTVVARELVFGEGPWSRYLGNARSIMRLDRLVSVNHEFKLFNRFYADSELLAKLWQAPLQTLDGANFTRLITEECHLSISALTQLVQMMPLDASVAELVDTAPQTMSLLVKTIATAGRDICIYYQESHIPPNHRALRFDERDVLHGEG